MFPHPSFLGHGLSLLVRLGRALHPAELRGSAAAVLMKTSHLIRSPAPPESVKPSYPKDFDPETIRTIEAVAPYTMTTPERIFGLCRAVDYIVENRLPGAFVECGVWKGGSMMAVAFSLIAKNECGRDLYLFDTFEGMSEPTKLDIDPWGQSADRLLQTTEVVRCLAPLDEVKQNMERTRYPGPIHYVQGKVEETLPGAAPEQIALLRLDTDWYESTLHELVHLFPRLVKGGVLIIDDYGWWKGARKAVDEYLAAHNVQILLNRMDRTGARIAIKI